MYIMRGYTFLMHHICIRKMSAMANSADNNLTVSLSPFSIFLVSNNMSKHLDSTAMLLLLACCIIVVSEPIGCTRLYSALSDDHLHNTSQIYRHARLM